MVRSRARGRRARPDLFGRIRFPSLVSLVFHLPPLSLSPPSFLVFFSAAIHERADFLQTVFTSVACIVPRRYDANAERRARADRAWISEE